MKPVAVATDCERFEVPKSKPQEVPFDLQQAALSDETGPQQAVSLAEALSL